MSTKFEQRLILATSTASLIILIVLLILQINMFNMYSNKEETKTNEVTTTTTITGTLEIKEDEEEVSDIEQTTTVVPETTVTTTTNTTTEEEPINVDEEEEIAYGSLSREFITVHSDLYVDTCPTVEELDALIDWWEPKILNGEGTTFKGLGWAFRQAWEETGLDPLVILGIAAWESGWGHSRIAMDKHNYFGIAAYDGSAYESAAVMGESVSEGIINGAKWIKKNYYDKGHTTMYEMNKNGYTVSMEWCETIVNDMINRHYNIMTTTILKEE